MRYVIADPQPFFRHSLMAALQGDGLEAIGGTGDEGMAASLAIEGRADVILSEIELERGSGLHLPKRVNGRVPVLILTRHPEGRVILEVAASGATGCLSHTVSLSRLTVLLRGLEVEEPSFCIESSRLSEILIEAGRTTEANAASDIQTLTVREREVLFRVATGADDAMIAQMLYISPHTVRTHVGNILRKLGVHSRAEAARVALASRLERPAGAEAVRIEGPAWGG
jgi:DNA-binding NarL/FixJ family response regulator